MEINNWPTVEVSVLSNASEIISSVLMEIGASGIEIPQETEVTTTLRAYFQPNTLPENLTQILHGSLSSFEISPVLAIKSIQIYSTPNQDWLEVWKQSYTYFPIGSKWLVVPSWKYSEAMEDNTFANRIWLEIDPGMAFGTGTHETTKLCLEFMESIPPSVIKNVLDVGTGTGILAMGAAKMFPKADIHACDIDPEAIEVAKHNIENNSVSNRITLQQATINNYLDNKFDLILANLTADVITPIAKMLLESLTSSGSLIISGILETQVSQIEEAFKKCTNIKLEMRQSGEWCAVHINHRQL